MDSQKERRHGFQVPVIGLSSVGICFLIERVDRPFRSSLPAMLSTADGVKVYYFPDLDQEPDFVREFDPFLKASNYRHSLSTNRTPVQIRWMALDIWTFGPAARGKDAYLAHPKLTNADSIKRCHACMLIYSSTSCLSFDSLVDEWLSLRVQHAVSAPHSTFCEHI